ncbi:RagB/SusD family nutrient uptake outer membrane protein [Marinilabiliaceae bacterium JC017]|nr:RagB/SusD family nutrient uptake outer membrane protein [Marinilabiliaceae bacterium JC017]
MKKGIFQNIGLLLFSLMILSSCVNDLDVTPIDPSQETADKVYTSEEAFAQGLAKIYAGFAVSGQEGPDGNGDLSGFDEGHSQYWRGYFVCQELPTDECVNGWSDGNLPKMSQITWGANNEFVRSFYYRAIYQVSLANEFIRQVNAVGKEEWTKLPQYVAEARFLRALAYWHALDLFGNGVPFVTENDPIGAFFPQPAGENPRGSELFTFIESELLDIVGDNVETKYELLAPRQGLVGQADKGAAWMLLAKLYLNHAVYLGSENADYYQKARTYINKVITQGGYRLLTDSDKAQDDVYSPYEFLFLADNYRSDDEIIYSINYDGLYSKTWGGTTYIMNAAIGGEMTPGDYGTNGGWGGNRTTKALVNKFDNGDNRALWFTEGQSLEITQQDQFSNGYAVVKFKNMTRDGKTGSNSTGGFADINVPVFRLSDAYLMAAEIDLRLDGTVTADNQNRIKEVRDRAGADMPASIDLGFILDERARELYWECHRRTDLIRFGKFTSGDYVWPLKGNDLNGKAVDEKYNLMPIPFTDITANPNLKQNPNY